MVKGLAEPFNLTDPAPPTYKCDYYLAAACGSESSFHSFGFSKDRRFQCLTIQKNCCLVFVTASFNRAPMKTFTAAEPTNYIASYRSILWRSPPDLGWKTTPKRESKKRSKTTGRVSTGW